MDVIICGAGRVGYGIAQKLASESNSVTVVDLSQDLIRQITIELDVRGVVGHGSHPDILKRAGVENADMIIAVTYSDEVNMVACQVAHSIFDVPVKVARVRAQSYLMSEYNDLYSRENLPIDVIISPEVEVGESILRRLATPGALNVVPFGDGLINLVTLRIEENTPIINTPIRQIPDLFSGLHACVVGISRDGQVFAPQPDDPLVPGDEAYVVTKAEHTARLLDIVGGEGRQARHIVIIGAGNVGAYVAARLEKTPGIRVRVIELDKTVAENAADTLKRTVILNGDAMDASVQEEAGVMDAECVLSVTNDDKTNILAGVLAKKLGAKQAYSLINDLSLQSMKQTLGIDMVIDPRGSTVSSILRHVRRGRIVDLFSVEEGLAEVMEGEVLETSPLSGKALNAVDIPEGIAIGAILRQGQVFEPSPELVLKIGDRIVLLAEKDSLSEVERLFRVSMSAF
ncbi:Trk system potassium transporter TrkA [Robiginitomaculum antarcticum]|uniref:Trk system potassium transporter TrkA n=1 Tax=Robiginitomaculum antarcticum TaxID=437507 RepID=UPI000361100E|nr:Trk system potassium transporter TrkA [Robiginitomaculum antarcticum]